MICYHGTTEKGLRAILSGVNHKPNSPWSCCDQDGEMYFWPLDKIMESDCIEDKEEGKNSSIIKSFESAQVQAAISGDSNIYVIEVEVDYKYLNDDLSADNMENIASYISISDFDSNKIINIYHTSFNKWHSPFIIKSLLSNIYFNQYSVGEDLLIVAESLH